MGSWLGESSAVGGVVIYAYRVCGRSRGIWSHMLIGVYGCIWVYAYRGIWCYLFMCVFSADRMDNNICRGGGAT